MSELRLVLRGLRATPLFTLGVVLTLSLAMGAAGVVYGTMRRLLLRPPPHVVEPGRLARPYFHYGLPGGRERAFDRLSYPFYERMREGVPGIAAVAAYEPDLPLVAGAGEEARPVRATLVSAGFWSTLRTRPLHGRLLADEEAHPATGARVAVLGHAYWRRRFRGDPAAVGSSLRVEGVPYRVVGIAPRGFRGVERTDTDLWLPLYAAADVAGRPADWHTAASAAGVKYLVRAAPGASPALATAALTREHALLIAAADPAEALDALVARPRTRVTLEGVGRAIDSRGRPLPEATVTLWSAGVAAALLAIAFANVAGLLLLRALRRRREIAVRLALGMTRGRLAGTLLLESAVLALLGGVGAGGLALAGGARVHRALLPGMVGESPGADPGSLLPWAAAVAGAALLTGLAPVLQTRREPAIGLREGVRPGGRRSRLQAGLLVAQVALSAALLVGAGLFVRSLHRVTALHLGVDAENTLVARLGLAREGRSPAALLEGAVARVRALPGVRAASLADDAPLREMRLVPARTLPAGEALSNGRAMPVEARVGDGYFEAVGTRILAGRGITPADREGAAVVVVSESLAGLAWPGRSPLGECLYLGLEGTRCARVVGVAGDARTFREGPPLALYTPLPRDATDDRVLLVRLAPGAAGAGAAVGRLLRGLDPGVVYVDAERLGDALDPELRQWRLGAGVFTAFGALAALLALLGLYTAIAYAVAERTREIGVRLAVGARAASVLGLVVGAALRVAAAGVAAGLTVALLGGRWIGGLLFETSARDPVVFAAVGGALLLAGVAAGLLPGWRAARVDPVEALRAE